MRSEVVNGQTFLIDDAGKAYLVDQEEVRAGKALRARAKAAKVVAQTFSPFIDVFKTADGNMHTLRVWAFTGHKGGTVSPAVAKALLGVGDAKALSLLREVAAFAKA